MSSIIVHKSLQGVLDVLQDKKVRHLESVRSLVAVYESVLENRRAKVCGDQTRFPFIVVEGLDGTGKTTATTMLSQRLNATLTQTPPPCIVPMRQLFDDCFIRSAYYALGNYIAAIQISDILMKQPVVLDRYWHSTAAYAIAQAALTHPTKNRIPPAKDLIYNWPLDLLKPDMVLLLEVSEAERVRRHALRGTTNTPQEQLLATNVEFRENVNTAYMNMYNPGVEIINADQPKHDVVNSMCKKVEHLFK